MKELASNEKFVSLVNVSEKKISELYLEELVLRFMSLYNHETVKNSIAQHMTQFMKESAENENFNYAQYKQIFEKTVSILSPLSYTIFRSANNEFSTAIYDTTMQGISKNIHLYGNAKPAVIQHKIEEIKKDNIYQKLVRSGGNNSVMRVRKRLEFAKQIFGKL